MRKFVSLSKDEDRHWGVGMGTVEALFELVHDHYEKMVDKPAFLYQLYMEGVVGVWVTLDHLERDQFRLFAQVMSDIYDAMLIDSAKQPYTGASSVYDVGVLVLLLSGDPRSVDYAHDPMLHKIGPDAYYSVPFTISRFIWSYVTALIHEKNLQTLAETLCDQTLQIKQGFDLTSMDHALLTKSEDALYSLKFVQRGYSNVRDPMRQSACDPYIDELIAIINGLRVALEVEALGGAKGEKEESPILRPLTAELLREASAELDAEIERQRYRISWSEKERLFWEALNRLRHTPEPEIEPEDPANKQNL